MSDWLTIGFFDENSKVVYPSLVNFDINNPNFSPNPFQPDTSDEGRINLNRQPIHPWKSKTGRAEIRNPSRLGRS